METEFVYKHIVDGLESDFPALLENGIIAPMNSHGEIISRDLNSIFLSCITSSVISDCCGNFSQVPLRPTPNTQSNFKISRQYYCNLSDLIADVPAYKNTKIFLWSCSS